MNPNTQPVSAPLEWVQSSYSGNNGNCVEVAVLPGGGRAFRDSKDPSGPIVTLSDSGFAAFLAAVGAGEFGRA